MKHWILSREGSLSIILVIWLFNSCVLKLKYASLVDIFKNYFSCFKDKEGHLLIAPLLNYMILPILLAGIIARENPISETIQNILTVLKYSLQGTTQGRYLTGGVPPVRFSM